MDRKTRLDHGVLCRLGFRLEGGKWYHVQDEGFSIRLTRTCFYVSFFGFESRFPYSPTVGKLEKLYLTGQINGCLVGLKAHPLRHDLLINNI